MQDNLFERNVDPVDAIVERQTSILGELSPKERAWLDKHHTVRVGINPDFYPMERFDAEGRYTGIGPDYLRILQKVTGLTFHVAPPADWTDTTDMAENKKVDMYIAAAETHHRAQVHALHALLHRPAGHHRHTPTHAGTSRRGLGQRHDQGPRRKAGRGGQPLLMARLPRRAAPRNPSRGRQKHAGRFAESGFRGSGRHDRLPVQYYGKNQQQRYPQSPCGRCRGRALRPRLRHPQRLARAARHRRQGPVADRAGRAADHRAKMVADPTKKRRSRSRPSG